MGQDDPTSRGGKPKPGAPTTPKRPPRAPKDDLHSAPTVPMKAIPMPEDDSLHSAPTVPMKAVPLPVEDPPAAPAAPMPAKASAPAPRAPPPPRPVARPPEAPSKPPPAASSGASASVPPAVSRPPPSESPSKPPDVAPKNAAPAVEVFRSTPPRPAQAPAPAPAPPAARPGQSTSVMLKAGKLRKLMEQTLGPKPSDAAPSSARPTETLLYDGTTPAPGLSVPHVDMLLVAPVQSYPGQRTVMGTRNVINQYAVASNPRYLPRPPYLRDVGHLFVFDVMHAQHTSLGSAFLAEVGDAFRPGTLAEIWKWLNGTAPARGWRAVTGGPLLDAMARGLPIIALADTPSGPRLAVVEPGPPGPDGKPLLASAHEPRGQRQSPERIFGSSPVRYLAHD